MTARHSILRRFIPFLAALWTACAPAVPLEAPQPCKGPSNPYVAHPAQDSTRSCLTLLTFNIRVGAGTGDPFTTVKNLPSSRETLGKVAEAIASTRPDVVALQEVRGLEQARFLAEKLEMNYVYCGHGRKDMDWGLALLSRFEIRAFRSGLIHTGRDPRIGLVSSVKAPRGDLLCVNLHYHLYGNYRNQVEQTLELLEGLEGPLVLMGDLNFSGVHAELGPIRKRLADTYEIAGSGTEVVKRRGTVSGWLSSYRLDHIFVEPRYFRVERVGLMGEAHREASDHIGYYACLAPL